MFFDIHPMNLRRIAESGQCFRWKRIEKDEAVRVYGMPEDIVRDRRDEHKSDADDLGCDIYVIPPFYGLREDSGPLVIADACGRFWSNCDDADQLSQWAHYFDIETDYEEVERRILASGDEHAIEAYESGKGIRILRQDLWEMIITFMISQNNNIRRITNSVEEICRRHGGAFPRPETFDISILDDRTIGLGYRAPYIKEIVKIFREEPTRLDELKKLDYEEAVRTLIGYTGIGPKGANCICLFGLHHTEAFPIDTHIKQLLLKYYPDGFPYDKYEGMAGIVQQYLFFYELKH